ncbi:MAG: hypothetical protein CME32_30580 [Gimesia sp.]|nr:hypothetical protein [Gimesia sp.]
MFPGEFGIKINGDSIPLKTASGFDCRCGPNMLDERWDMDKIRELIALAPTPHDWINIPHPVRGTMMAMIQDDRIAQKLSYPWIGKDISNCAPRRPTSIDFTKPS